MKLRNCPNCRLCDKEGTVQHTFFECPKWQTVNYESEVEYGREIAAHDIGPVLMQDEKSWGIICRWSMKVLRTKKEEDVDGRRNNKGNRQKR